MFMYNYCLFSPGDVLVYVNETCVLGFKHGDAINIFKAVPIGEYILLQVCRGYALPFDSNNTDTVLQNAEATAELRQSSSYRGQFGYC